MEGNGVTNYAPDKPSYACTAATTEWDDQLMQRGIVTLEQVLQAKGMSPSEAQRLCDLKTNETNNNAVKQQQEDEMKMVAPRGDDVDQESDDDTDYFDDDDDDFLNQYRQKRMAEMKQMAQQEGEKTTAQLQFGSVIPISRTEWHRHVNDDSERTWVVVCLTSHGDHERTGCVTQAVQELADSHQNTKFVTIPSHHAIPNWPHDNLPTLFLYRHGKLQHQMVRMKPSTSTEELESQLQELSVL